jgi:hypothetical protein
MQKVIISTGALVIGFALASATASAQNIQGPAAPNFGVNSNSQTGGMPLFVPQTGRSLQNLPTLSGSGPGGAETFQDRAARCINDAGVSGQATTGSAIGSCVNQ